MAIKHLEADQPNFTRNPNCPWCKGNGWIKVPSIANLKGDGNQIMNLYVVFCEPCFNKPPIDGVSSLSGYVDRVNNAGGSLYRLKHYLETEILGDRIDEGADILKMIDDIIAGMPGEWWDK